jgi:hypothetical protein
MDHQNGDKFRRAFIWAGSEGVGGALPGRVAKGDETNGARWFRSAGPNHAWLRIEAAVGMAGKDSS